MYTGGVLQYEGVMYSGSKRRLFLIWLLCVRLMVRRNTKRCRCLCGCDKVPGCRRIVCSICQRYICPGVCLAIEFDPIVGFAACRRCSWLCCTPVGAAGRPSADAIRDLVVAWLCYVLNCVHQQMQFVSKWAVLSCVLNFLSGARV